MTLPSNAGSSKSAHDSPRRETDGAAAEHKSAARLGANGGRQAGETAETAETAVPTGDAPPAAAWWKSWHWREWYRRCKKFLVHDILHADDPPHRLALGFAIAMFVTFTPTIGFQMVLAVFFAWLFRANKVVGIPLVWITNPVTMGPIFYGCYLVGCLVLGQPQIEWAWWANLANPPAGWWPGVKFYWMNFLQVAWPLWIGSLVVALALAVVSYYGIYYLVCWYRLKRWGQLTPPTNADHRKAA